MLEKNQVYTAEITGLTSEGSGVCRVENMAVFVPETAVGDIIKVKILKVLSSYAFGKAEEIITASSDRRDPACPVFRRCGGCVYQHINYEAECRAKAMTVEDAFRRIGGLDPVYDEFIKADNTLRYRNKAQYPLAVKDDKAVCGFFAPRSHRVVEIEDCVLQPAIFSEIVKASLSFINKKKLSVYDEIKHSGILRHIYIRKGSYSNQIMLCFVVRKDISRELNGLCRILSQEFKDIVSIVMNINPDKTNVILGDRWITLFGKPYIFDKMCGNNIQISPPSFYQVNTIQAEKLYAKALDYASPTPNSVIADLYCGAGTIGLSMASYAASVVGIEIIPEAVENARINAANNDILNARFHCGDAGDVFEQLRLNGCSPDIIVLDPPRKGCSSDTVKSVINASPDKIVMISCNPSTAARDAKIFSENGFIVERVCGADLFPMTKHVECVVLMSRKK